MCCVFSGNDRAISRLTRSSCVLVLSVRHYCASFAFFELFGVLEATFSSFLLYVHSFVAALLLSRRYCILTTPEIVKIKNREPEK